MTSVKGKDIYKAWAEINVSHVRHNIRELRRLIGDAAVEMMAVLKDDAYGHGIDIVAPAVIEEGVKYIGVATVLEGQRLRAIDKDVNIVVFGCFFLGNIEYVFKENLIPVICSYDIARVFNAEARKTGKSLKVHLMLDTGMGRVGVWWQKGVDFIRKVNQLSHIQIEGVCSHFAAADTDEHFSKEQIKRFDSVIFDVEKDGINIPFKHIANSIGIINIPDSLKYNMVRPGIAIYGIDPDDNMKRNVDLKPVLSLRTWIVYLKSVLKGRTISYGRTYAPKKRTKIATISIGYGDGYNRLLSNKGEVIVRGKKAKVVGVVTMDQTMIDVGAIGGVSVGDEVVLIGSEGGVSVTVREIAKLISSIPYEIVCYIGRRVKRIRVE